MQAGFENAALTLKGREMSRRPAILRGYQLYHFPVGYPGMYRAPDLSHVVKGEVVEVLDSEYDSSLRLLDVLEDYHGEGNPQNLYDRIQAKAETADESTPVDVWAYVCRLDPEDEAATHVPDGDWRRYVAREKVVVFADDWSERYSSAASSESGDEQLARRGL